MQPNIRNRLSCCSKPTLQIAVDGINYCSSKSSRLDVESSGKRESCSVTPPKFPTVEIPTVFRTVVVVSLVSVDCVESNKNEEEVKIQRSLRFG